MAAIILYAGKLNQMSSLLEGEKECKRLSDRTFFIKGQVHGNILVVENTRIEYLDEPETVYNFQVEDFHTYDVGTNCIFVHNNCEDLLKELANSGVKYNPDDIVKVMRNTDGKLMWLENGNSKAGLIHILERHRNEFLSQGVKNIPQLLEDVVSTTPVKQGGNTIGLFADYVFNGNSYRVAYGRNGFVVSFYPID